MRGWIGLGIVLVLLVGYLALDVQYGHAWASRLALAIWAQEHAPLQPWALNAVAVALMEDGRFVEAQAALDREAGLLQDPAIVVTDRPAVLEALQHNRVLLARMSRH